jgi:hypothetical protein
MTPAKEIDMTLHKDGSVTQIDINHQRLIRRGLVRTECFRVRWGPEDPSRDSGIVQG